MSFKIFFIEFLVFKCHHNVFKTNTRILNNGVRGAFEESVNFRLFFFITKKCDHDEITKENTVPIPYPTIN